MLNSLNGTERWLESLIAVRFLVVLAERFRYQPFRPFHTCFFCLLLPFFITSSSVLAFQTNNNRSILSLNLRIPVLSAVKVDDNIVGRADFSLLESEEVEIFDCSRRRGSGFV